MKARNIFMTNATAILFGFSVSISQTAYAQEQVMLNVNYEFQYVRDLANKAEPYNANMILSLGKETSRYCSEKCYNDHDPKMRLEKEKMQQRPVSSSGSATVVSGGPLLVVNKHGALINEEIVKDVKLHRMKIIANMGFKSYRIEDVLPAIKWEIGTDKKTIGNYNCQKATGEYGGRVYDVWFAPELPFNNGPWKFSGLPGLILEAADQRNEVRFVFKGMTKNTDQEETTASFLSSNYNIKTDIKSYHRTKQEFETDPEAVMSALAPNAKLSVKNMDDIGSQAVKKIRRYNPMEIK